MKLVDEHLADCLAAVDRTIPVETPLLEALGLVLAEDVVSPVDLPCFDNSAMDGYAVRVPDVAAASPQQPAILPVVADLPAGAGEAVSLRPGAVARIMTGAPIPDGADAIVPVEWTDAGTSTVAVRRPPGPGQYVRRAGEDVRVGEAVLAAGTRLSSRHIALLAAIGRAGVSACPAPRVVVLSSGSELTRPGAALARGSVYDANGYGLVAAARELGATACHAGIVADDEDAVLAALRSARAEADLVVVSGGISAGGYDTVKAVLRGLGSVRFEKVAMQPGMPQGFGRIGPDGTPIFALPGNPVSSMVSFEVFVRPVLRKLAGELSPHRLTVTAIAGSSWRSSAGKRQFVRALLQTRDDGVLVVVPVGGQGSHLVADLAVAGCLAVVPEDVTEVEPGHPLTCLLFEQGGR
jgi:molybdopterin molybdotransferase